MKKPTEDLVLWGRHPEYINDEPIRLARGTNRQLAGERKWREKLGGWMLATYEHGDEPIGLREMVR